MIENTTELQWIVIFRMDEDRADALYKELKEGRLRQGWGGPGMGLLDRNKKEWEKNYKKTWGESPSRRRYSALTHLLEIKEGDLVVMPKMPAAKQFSIARVVGGYKFRETELIEGDFGHIIPVDPDSVRTFHYRANDDAYTVSGLFRRANHRYPVTFAYDKNHINAASRLLKSEDCLESKGRGELVQAALDDAIMKAAQTMKDEIKSWNGAQFEEAVKKAFLNQGYEDVTNQYRRYDGEGADVDLVVRPPSNNYSLFMPPEIAVQIKWKQGIDQGDIDAVKQLAQWQESETGQKFVISSADAFTKKCKNEAVEKDITLIGGLGTMYFLMGLPNLIGEN